MAQKTHPPNSSFVRTGEGWVFAPWGLLGRSYVLPDTQTRNAIRRQFYLAHALAAIAFPITALTIGVAAMFVVAIVWLLLFQSWKVYATRGFPRSTERTESRSIDRTGRLVLWIVLGCSIALVVEVARKLLTSPHVTAWTWASLVVALVALALSIVRLASTRFRPAVEDQRRNRQNV